MKDIVEAPPIWVVAHEPDPLVKISTRFEIPCGLSVSEALDLLQVDAEARPMLSIFLGGVPLPNDAWAATRPVEGEVVQIVAVPGLPGLGALLGSIAGSFATSALAGLGVSSTVASLGGLAISFGVQALFSSLFQPPQVRPTPDTETRYAIRGTRNEARPYGPIPVVLGRTRVFPILGAQSVTEVLGNDQYVRGILLWGVGPIELSDIRIGNTPIENFEGVELEHDLDGTSETMGLYPVDIDEQDLNIELTTDWVARTTAIDTEEIGITVTFPQGLYSTDPKTGNRRSRGVTITGEYRLEGDEDWTEWFSEGINRAENAVVRFAKSITGLPSGRYEVRLTRSALAGSTTHVEDCFWSSLQSFQMGAPVNLPGVAKTAFRIKANGQLSGVVDEINAIAALKVPVWDGEAWTETPEVSVRPAALYRWALTGPANPRPVGAAFRDDATLGEWYEECVARDYRYSREVRDGPSVFDALKEIAAAGYAAPKISGQRWSVAMDRAQSYAVQHFTPRNSWGFSGATIFADQPHALRVQFLNAERGHVQDEIIVYAQGYNAANATRYEPIPAPGIEYAADAHWYGQHFLRSGRLRPERWSLSTALESVVAERGDLVRLTHDIALIGQVAARVTAVTSDPATVTLDEIVTFEAGKSYTLRVRRATTEIETRSVALAATGTGSTKTVAVDDLNDVQVGDLAVFGEDGLESVLCIVDRVSPGEDESAQVDLIVYNEHVYARDSEAPPYSSVISLPVTPRMSGPRPPFIDAIRSDEAALPRDLVGTPRPTILIELRPGASVSAGTARVTLATQFRARWRRTGTAEAWESQTVPISAGRIRITGVEARQEYDLRIEALDEAGNPSTEISLSHQVVGLSAPPPAVDTLELTSNGDQTYAVWTYPSIVGDVTGYELRYHPDVGVTDWGRMSRIAAEIGRGTRQFMVPSRTGSYAIKAIDANGTRSVAATFANATMTSAMKQNTIATISEAPAFSGAKSDTLAISGTLRLDGTVKMSDWATLSELATIASDGYETSGTYSFGETDFGGVFTARIAASINAAPLNYRDAISKWVTLSSIANMAGDATGDEFDIALEISVSTADSPSPVWGEWRRFVIGDFTARHVRFRLSMSTTDEQIIPAVNLLSVSITMPDRFETDQNIASGTTTYGVAFDTSFKALKSITITPKNSQVGDTWEITNEGPDGFDIIFRNGGTPVDRTFDYQAIGYGQEAS